MDSLRLEYIVSTLKKYVNKAIAAAVQNTVTINNLTATAAPTATDDITKKYSKGSIWIYDGATYICVDATENKAVWQSSADIYYFSTWDELVAAISVAGTTYVGKYAEIANANGAPSSGVTYTAPASLTDSIFDGGSATVKVNVQGTNYSVTTQARTVTNPVIKSVMLTASAKPTTPGYYIFTVIPTDGLPTGVSINDIAYYNGSTWSCWQKYASATTVIVAGATLLSQVTWRKFNGTWMSTADEYIPDGKEYQTGKLYNGKPVYRKCYSGTLSGASQNISPVGGIPMTGTILLILGTFYRSTGTVVTMYTALTFAVNTYGTLISQNGDVSGNSGTFIAWVEYTKS